MKIVNWVAYVLVVIGGLNVGLAALRFDVLAKVLGTGTVATVVYVLVGLAALLAVFTVRPAKRKTLVAQPVM